jgi:tRNA modification GTPase
MAHMRNLNLNDTIVAISTPIGQAGIGIVRLSGPDSLSVADRIFKPAIHNGKKKIKPSQFKSHTINYGWIIDREYIIDEVLLTVMRQPRTYTREDIVEINCHSGIAVLKKILNLVVKYGARLAEPGEFTRRAFVNGRIDLSQAESVLDIIRTKSDNYLQSCFSRLEGGFSRQIEKISQELFEAIAQLQAQIDFPEENTSTPKKQLLSSLGKINKSLGASLKNTQEAKVLRDGISVAIVGRPNVGKSSLLNALLNEQRVLVTPFPGTTRDTIEETVCIDSIPIKFIDTAGLRKSTDPIENLATKRSQQVIDTCQLLLVVFDGSRSISKADLKFIKKFGHKKNILAVLNKIDLPLKFNIKILKKNFKDFVKISALRQSGLGDLKKKITNQIWKGNLSADDCGLIVNERQEKLLTESAAALEAGLASLAGGIQLEIVVEYLKQAHWALNRLCPKYGDLEDELLDTIFSQFCIGK